MLKTFLVFLEGRQEKPPTPALTQTHVAYLQALHEAGALVMCGPLTNGECALLILRAPSLETATVLIKNDPFIVHKYYEVYALEEFIPATPANNWLAHPNVAE